MNAALDLRDRLRELYAHYDIFLRPVFKFLLCFLILSLIEGYTGQMKLLNRMPVKLLASLFAALTPYGTITFVALLFMLGHMYAVSLSMALFAAVLFLLIGFLYFGFRPGNGIVLILVVAGYLMKLPYAVPVVLGLCAGAASSVPCALGVVVWFVLRYFHQNAQSLAAAADNASIITDFTVIARAILTDRFLLLTLIAFTLCVLTVSVVSRMSMDHAWTIASASGIAVLAVILIGAAAAASDRSILSDVLGLLTAFLTALVYEYFVLGLDYRGTERVQFEDDDYYYYVKAVPKLKPENEEERFV